MSRARYQAEDQLLNAYGVSNPVFFLERALRYSTSNRGRAEGIVELLTRSGVYGSTQVLRPLRRRLKQALRLSGFPRVTAVQHVFPVVSANRREAFMVPLRLAEEGHWQLSDAFSRFGFGSLRRVSPAEGFDRLMRRIEKSWTTAQPDLPLPLRWRKALSVGILCPVHLDAIEGNSLHLPLLVAVLRELGRIPESERRASRLPFGDRPVFATGQLAPDDTFLPAGSLKQKLAGFLREYGSGNPAILSTHQAGSLSRDRSGKLLLKKVVVCSADNLAELLALPALRGALRRIAAPPHPAEIDDLLVTMKRMRHGIRYMDVEILSQWLLKGEESPWYRFKVLRHVGLALVHRGDLLEARRHLWEAADLVHGQPDLFGAADRLALGTALGSLAFSACDAEQAWGALKGVEALLEHVSIADRARMWSMTSQIHRLEGGKDRAVADGRRAISAADASRANESGRIRNHLVHALISRARGDDLEEARSVLEESRWRWRPRTGERAVRTHLGFCLYYEAEISRLRGEPFDARRRPHWPGGWGFPGVLVALSCARNAANPGVLRHRWGRELDTLVRGRAAGHPQSLNAMLHHAYRLFAASLEGEVLTGEIAGVRTWCAGLAHAGLAGWERRLAPALEAFDRKEGGAGEMLCALIPFH